MRYLRFNSKRDKELVIYYLVIFLWNFLKFFCFLRNWIFCFDKNPLSYKFSRKYSRAYWTSNYIYFISNNCQSLLPDAFLIQLMPLPSSSEIGNFSKHSNFVSARNTFNFTKSFLSIAETRRRRKKRISRNYHLKARFAVAE